MDIDLRVLLFAFGAMLLVMIIVINLLIDKLSETQQHYFQIVIALAAALIATAIPGFLLIKSDFVGLALQAGGAIAVFIFVYRLKPATISPEKSKSESKPEPKTPKIPVWGCLLLVVFIMGVWSIFGFTDFKMERVLAQVTNVLPLPFLENHSVTLNQTAYSSNVEGFTTTLTQVEFLENGRMRWHFQFWNQSSAEQNLGFNFAATYLTDGSGNRYSVIGTDTGVIPNETFTEKVPAGVRVEHWFEFSPSLNGTRQFNVVIAHAHLIPHFGGVEFPAPLFTVNLDGS